MLYLGGLETTKANFGRAVDPHSPHGSAALAT